MPIKHISECDWELCGFISTTKDERESDAVAFAHYCTYPTGWPYFEGKHFHSYACLSAYAAAKERER